MSVDILSQLIIITTHDCNLRCKYCPVSKKKNNIKTEFAKKAIRLFLSLNRHSKDQLVIKFFGGEPFLCFGLIKEVVSCAKKLAGKKKINFQISTNGTLLDDKTDYLEKHKNISISLSLDGDYSASAVNRRGISEKAYKNIINNKKITSLKGLVVNMVIAPGQAASFHDNFLYLQQKGFKKFNFLPAYFVLWKKNQLKELISGFDRVYDLYKKNKKTMILPKNTEVSGRLVFFNEGIVVDHNGDIFFNNAVLSERFHSLRSKFKAGNISNIKEKDLLLRLKRYRSYDPMLLLKKQTPRNIFLSTMLADRILSRFIRKLTGK
jgi:sulfatase maturation enzyme AslB (radical SAM superfamily)